MREDLAHVNRNNHVFLDAILIAGVICISFLRAFFNILQERHSKRTVDIVIAYNFVSVFSYEFVI